MHHSAPLLQIKSIVKVSEKWLTVILDCKRNEVPVVEREHQVQGEHGLCNASEAKIDFAIQFSPDHREQISRTAVKSDKLHRGNFVIEVDGKYLRYTREGGLACGARQSWIKGRFIRQNANDAGEVKLMK